MKTEIDGVEILSLEVVLYGERSNTDEVDLGAVTLTHEGREYILDVTQSFTCTGDGFTQIECRLERDDDTFPDCKYDLTAVDLMLGDVDATFYISSDLPVEEINLFVRQGDCTKAIDVVQE